MAKTYSAPIDDKGRPERPSSSKHDAKVNPRSTGANGGTGNNAAGPYLAPDMSKVER